MNQFFPEERRETKIYRFYEQSIYEFTNLQESSNLFPIPMEKRKTLQEIVIIMRNYKVFIFFSSRKQHKKKIIQHYICITSFLQIP